MRCDIFGQPVSLANDEALKSWNDVMFGILSHSYQTPNHLANVLKLESNFALAHIVKGLFYLLLGRRELVILAGESLAQAKEIILQQNFCRREQAFLNCLESWCCGNPHKAVFYLEDYLLHFAQDALAAKIVHSICFIFGDIKTMRCSIERVLANINEGHRGRGYLFGCHAFALEEMHEYKLAESVGRQALELSPNDAWGLHAVAHVYDMQAQAKAGIEFLANKESAWSHCNNFRYHVWWHKALMYLELNKIDKVLQLYDEKIRNEKTDDYRDIANAASLLSRLQLNGIDVGGRWQELADLSENRTQDGCFIFADLHYLLALLGGGRKDMAAKLLSRLQQEKNNYKNNSQQGLANLGYVMACGLQSFCAGNYEIAFKNLVSVCENMQSIGGSHAQRDIFERIMIDSGLRAGFFAETKNLLSRRQAKRGFEDGYSASRFSLMSQTLAVAN